MDENKDKAQGKLDELTGKVKKGLGDLTGDEQMEAEGAAQEFQGQATTETAKARGRAAGTLDELGGKVKKGVGDLLDDEKLEAEGHVDELKGKARQESNK